MSARVTHRFGFDEAGRITVRVAFGGYLDQVDIEIGTDEVFVEIELSVEQARMLSTALVEQIARNEERLAQEAQA